MLFEPMYHRIAVASSTEYAPSSSPRIQSAFSVVESTESLIDTADKLLAAERPLLPSSTLYN